MTGDVTDRLRVTLERTEEDRELTGVVVAVERPSGGVAWSGARGDITTTTPFFIASTTKLYTSAIVFRLAERGVLGLDDRLVDWVEGGTVDRLHVHRSVDYTDRITIRNLLAQTSGVADYFLGKRPDGTSLEETIRAGVDAGWTLEEAVAMARSVGAAFPPGTKGKALYSDTNYQLLGHVIENALGTTYGTALGAEILEPLRLKTTWLHSDPNDDSDLNDSRAVALRDGRSQLEIPKAMASFGPDGGVVADVGDLMVFLRAYFEGGLFDPAYVTSGSVYNRIFFPLEYGVGFSRFRLPRLLAPLGAPELLGHSGLSGAFAFLDIGTGTYLAGTVNNIATPSRSFRLMLKLIQAIKKSR